MAITRTEYEHMKAKLLRNLAEAEAQADATRNKLLALEVLESELLEDDAPMATRPSGHTVVFASKPSEAKSLTMEEVAALIPDAPSKFSHIVIQELAQAKFGPVNPASVRVGLNRIARRSDSPIKASDPGAGQRPTVFEKKGVSDIFS